MFTTSIRVDANEQIGLGHLRRCLALADELRDRGSEVRFICSDRTVALVGPSIRPHRLSAIAPFAAKRVDENAGAAEIRDADATLAIISRHPPEASWVVVDSYRLGQRWERRVREAGHRVLAIDDFRNRRHHADLLVGNSRMPFDAAISGAVEGARHLIGREYTLIGREYRYLHPSFPTRPAAKRVLVSYGGSDPTGETMKALKAIGIVRRSSHTRSLGGVDIVIGPLNRMSGFIEEAVLDIDGLVLHRAPESLAPLMGEADLIMTSGGNSMAEALTMRKPCLITMTAENQSLGVTELMNEGAVHSLGPCHNVGAQEVAAALAQALAEYESFASKVAAHAFFDDLGASRIALAMSDPMSGQSPTPVRPVSESVCSGGALR